MDCEVMNNLLLKEFLTGAQKMVGGFLLKYNEWIGDELVIEKCFCFSKRQDKLDKLSSSCLINSSSYCSSCSCTITIAACVALVSCSEQVRMILALVECSIQSMQIHFFL